MVSNYVCDLELQVSELQLYRSVGSNYMSVTSNYVGHWARITGQCVLCIAASCHCDLKKNFDDLFLRFEFNGKVPIINESFEISNSSN